MSIVRAIAPLVAIGLAVLLSLPASSAKKQPRTRTQSDGGVVLLGPDPPGKLRHNDALTSDAGPRVVTVPDAGVAPANSQQAQIDQLKSEITQLQQQVRNTSSQNEQLQQTNAQLAALRDQLQQAENDRNAREQNAAARRRARSGFGSVHRTGRADRPGRSRRARQPRPLAGALSAGRRHRPGAAGSVIRKARMSVRVEKSGAVVTIILDRPEARNAVDAQAAGDLAHAFREFESDPAASVAVLWGAGGNFCAGADLKKFDNRIAPDGDGPMGPTRLTLSKPCIAAISGYAVAGGLELALLCDLRVVEEDAILGVFCRRFGVPLIDGGTVRLPRLIGLSRALDLILTGRPVDAREALQFGLANRVVAKGESRSAAEQLAQELAALPQECLRGDRLSAYEQWNLPFAVALQNELQHGMHSLASGGLDGAKKFREGAGRHGE
jgi:enoyl-CoA hydratase